jgi:hypothetical protein
MVTAMADWQIVISIVAGWFAVSLLVAVVIGKALRFAGAPASFRAEGANQSPSTSLALPACLDIAGLTGDRAPGVTGVLPATSAAHHAA